LGIAATFSSRTGIFFGWWVVFASATLTFLTGGTFFYGFSALFNPIIDEFGWSSASLAFAFSLRSEIGGLASPVVGFAVDRIGPRLLMAGGVLTVAAGFALMSRVESLWGLYGAVAVIAIGMSAAAGPVGMVAVTHWFSRKRGRALATLATVTGMSGIMVLVLAGLISAFGWRDSLLIMAVVQVIVCFPLALTIRNRPADVGLRPDGDPIELDAEGVQVPLPPLEGLTVRQAIRHPSFWKLAAMLTLVNMGMITVIVHQIPFFTKSVGLSNGLAAASVTVMLMFSLIGRFGIGSMSDVVNKRYVMAGACFLCGMSLLLYATVYDGWQIAYALPVFAIGWGGIIPTRPAFQAEYFGLKAFGAIQGLTFTVATLGALVGPVFAGWMFDETESYRLSFVILSLGGLASVPLVLSMTKPEWGAASG
jgi:sugar phosphate permease